MSNSTGPKSHKRIVFLEGADPMSRAACTCPIGHGGIVSHPRRAGKSLALEAARRAWSVCPRHNPDGYAATNAARRADKGI